MGWGPSRKPFPLHHLPPTQQMPETWDIFSAGTMQACLLWLISPPGPWPRLGTVHICWQECPPQMIWCLGKGDAQDPRCQPPCGHCCPSTRDGNSLGDRNLDESQVSDSVSPSHRARGFQQGTILETAGKMSSSGPMMPCTREALTPKKGVDAFTQQRYLAPPVDQHGGAVGARQ